MRNRIKDATEFIESMRRVESGILVSNQLSSYALETVIKEVAQAYPKVKVSIRGKAQVVADQAIYSIINNIIHTLSSTARLTG